MTTNKYKCLIIGGGGFIGSHLARRLVEKNYSVTIFSLGKVDNNINLKDLINKINYIEGDLNNTDQLAKIIDKNTYIFDLATSSVPSTSAIESLIEIQSHIRLIEIACQKNVKKIIFTSSGGGVYGHKKKMPISELQHLQPSSPHAISKTTIEYFMAYYCNLQKIPYIIYRISNPYGPGQIAKTGFGLIPTLFSNVLSKNSPKLYHNGMAVRDFIYINDLIEAITQSSLIDNKHNVYNIGSSNGTRIIDIWEKIKSISNSSLSPILLPKREFDVDKYILDTKRFRQEYNWKPETNLDNGLMQTWTWINKNR